MTRRILLVALLPGLLCGCAAQPSYQPVDISVPIATPCSVPTMKPPAWPLQTLTPAAPLFDKVKMALTEIELRKAYETQIQAQLKACE